MLIDCPRCKAPNSLNEADASPDGRLRTRCVLCKAPLLIQVNRPDLRVSDRIPLSPNAEDGEPAPEERPSTLGSFEIDLGGIDDSRAIEPAWLVLVIRQLDDIHLPELRRALMEHPRYRLHPNKLHDATGELPYVIQDLSEGQLSGLEDLLEALEADFTSGLRSQLLNARGELRPEGADDPGAGSGGLPSPDELDVLALDEEGDAVDLEGSEDAHSEAFEAGNSEDDGDAIALAAGQGDGNGDHVALEAGDDDEAALEGADGGDGEALGAGDHRRDFDRSVEPRPIAIDTGALFTLVEGGAGDGAPLRPIARDDVAPKPPRRRPEPPPSRTPPPPAPPAWAPPLPSASGEEETVELEPESDEVFGIHAGDADLFSEAVADDLRRQGRGPAPQVAAAPDRARHQPVDLLPISTLPDIPSKLQVLGLVQTTGLAQVGHVNPPEAQRTLASTLRWLRIRLSEEAAELGASSVLGVRTTLTSQADGDVLLLMEGTAIRAD